MTEKYSIEIWDPTTRRYHVAWTGHADWAERMFNKPYHAKHTRRLVKTTTEILKKEKGRRNR